LGNDAHASATNLAVAFWSRRTNFNKVIANWSALTVFCHMHWLLADAHGGANQEADEQMIELLELALQKSVDLYILGDLFAVWIAPERFLTPYQKKVMSLLKGLKQAQREVVFVVGNRDYLVKEAQLGETFTEVIEHEATVLLGKKRTLLLHGDRINPEDRLYELWYRLSRNPISMKLLQKMPSTLAQKFSQTLEQKLAQTNQAYKTGHLPTQHLEALSRRGAALGVEQVLLGHFHADTTIKAVDGVPVTIAPAWLDQRKILTIDEGGVILSQNPLIQS
jgi:UDP-2,3-diacylglucosamine hydrolase